MYSAFVTPEPDAELQAVAEYLLSNDPAGVRTAKVLRRTFDMLLDGQHTGRYRWDQLYKTEKTHFGTLVEINLQREFGFADGQSMDFAIEGVDVDCKYAQSIGEWMIPRRRWGTSSWGCGRVTSRAGGLLGLSGSMNRFSARRAAIVT
jgi:hypothetical protein